MGLRFFAGLLSFVTGKIRKSWPYREGFSRACRHPDVIAALGEPIEAAPLFNGSFSSSESDGSAKMAVPIRGTKATGTMLLVAQKQQGRWSFRRAEVVLEDGARIIDLRTKRIDATAVEVLPPVR